MVTKDSGRKPWTLERLRARMSVDPATGCWNWQGTTTNEGYGNGATMDEVKAARAAIAKAEGTPPPFHSEAGE